MIGKYDVIVAGAGVSGVLAAVAAARTGAEVLLIERYGHSGGIATAGLMACFNAFRNEIQPNDFQAVNGYPQEVIDRLIEHKGASGSKGSAPYCVPFSTEILKKVFDDMLEDAGVSVLYHVTISDLEVKEGRIESLELVSKSGKKSVQAGIFVDATGDGDLSALAGAPFEIGDENNGKTLSMQTMFKVSNIDPESVIKTVLQNQDKYGTQYHLSPLNKIEELYRDGYPIGIRGFKEYLAQHLDLNGDIACIIHRGEALFWGGIKQGEKSLITAGRVNSLDLHELTKAEINGRKIVNRLMQAILMIPGFENACLTQTGAVGVRETRRIKGLYQLTEKDALEGRRFEDVIAIGINPIPSNNGQRVYLKHEGYDIPYRCLVTHEVDNLIVTGRCISADHLSFQSARSMGTAMAVGQAAGAAAALSGKSNSATRSIDIMELQKLLIAQGAELGQNRKATTPFNLPKQ